MNIIRYTPNRWIDGVFDRYASDFFAGLPVNHSPSDTSAFAPRVDIREKDNRIVLTAELPGVDRDSLKVEVKEGVLTLQGEKNRGESKENDGYYRSERVYGSFSRRFTLPDDVDGNAIEAAYNDGVLVVALPKKPESAPKTIAIQDGKAAKQIGLN